MVTQITVIAEMIRNGQILNICLPTCLLRNLFEEIGSYYCGASKFEICSIGQQAGYSAKS